tara:strand:+ start:14199 stop:14459 length:261 start_codon:yes stop_codon:yes gene_type:complete
MANNKMMYSDGGAKMKMGGSCMCSKTMPMYSNNPRSLSGQMLMVGGQTAVNSYLDQKSGTLKVDKKYAGGSFRRSLDTKVMKRGGY